MLIEHQTPLLMVVQHKAWIHWVAKLASRMDIWETETSYVISIRQPIDNPRKLSPPPINSDSPTTKSNPCLQPDPVLIKNSPQLHKQVFPDPLTPIRSTYT